MYKHIWVSLSFGASPSVVVAIIMHTYLWEGGRGGTLVRPHLRPCGHRPLWALFPSTSAPTWLPTGLAFPDGYRGLILIRSGPQRASFPYDPDHPLLCSLGLMSYVRLSWPLRNHPLFILRACEK